MLRIGVISLITIIPFKKEIFRRSPKDFIILILEFCLELLCTHGWSCVSSLCCWRSPPTWTAQMTVARSAFQNIQTKFNCKLIVTIYTILPEFSRRFQHINPAGCSAGRYWRYGQKITLQFWSWQKVINSLTIYVAHENWRELKWKRKKTFFFHSHYFFHKVLHWKKII